MRVMALSEKKRPNYGWDAPGIMLAMLGVGVVVVATGVTLVVLRLFVLSRLLGVILAVGGAIPLLLGLAMVQYGLLGKHRTRDIMLDLVSWRGDERVLDIGTGAGMLLIGAAKRLKSAGLAVGIDIWAAKDLSDNSAEATCRNIALEGVQDRAEVRTDDATRLSFADATFDVVLSLLCLHNIEPQTNQTVACREIARVLKPGGRVVIGDYVPTHGYAQTLREAGLDVKQSRAALGVAGALMWLLVADKPIEPTRK
jgi:SAM-dependent methyltransferase